MTRSGRALAAAALVGAVLAAGCTTDANEEPDSTSTTAITATTRELWDGESLTGWEHSGDGSFRIVTLGDATSALETVGGMGLLWYADEEFADFELTVEWRTEAPDDNSGVFVRFPDPGVDPWVAVHHGHEVQIYDGQHGEDQKTGALYEVAPPLARASRPAGEWNEYRIRVTGDRYRVWLNGTLVQDHVPTDGDVPDRGHVGLQNHGRSDLVQFRNVQIRTTSEEHARG